MVTIEDAFTDAWRSFRIKQGVSPADLPDPLGRRVQKKIKIKKKGRVEEQRDKNRAGSSSDLGGGGFLPEEESAGGFIVDDSIEDSIAVEEQTDEEERIEGAPEYIPLSSIPDALATLSLPTNDDFVLDLFAQTAVYLNDDARRRRRVAASTDGAAGIEKMVSLLDFKRVANVLLDGNGDDDGSSLSIERVEVPEDEASEMEVDEVEEDRRLGSRRRPLRTAAASANKRRRKQIQQEEEVENASDDEDAYREASEQEEEEAEENARGRSAKANQRRNKAQVSASGGLRRSRKAKGYKADTTATDENDEEEEGHLNATQRRTVHAAFRLFTDKLQEVRGDVLDESPRLSKDDLKLLVKSVGEKIPEKEIDEMIDEGIRFFAKASSKDITRQNAKLRRDAAAGRASARGETNRSVTVGIDEFAGILLQGRLI